MAAAAEEEGRKAAREQLLAAEAGIWKCAGPAGTGRQRPNLSEATARAELVARTVD